MASRTDMKDGDQSLSSVCSSMYRRISLGIVRHARHASGGGPKGPPSAPPAIPPIIINPYSYQTPGPAIDPRVTPLRPPVTPPSRPAVCFQAC